VQGIAHGAVIAAGTELWSSAEWREGAVAWLDAQLRAAGQPRTGPVEQPHLRPWATALRAPTAQGAVWLKAASPGTSFEIRLYPLLQRSAPEWVLPVLAVDLERSWIVLPDGGATLGQSAPAAQLISGWLQVLPQYAELQRKLAPHAGEMLALGLADMRAEVLPERFQQALEEAQRYARKHDNAADRELCQRIEQFRGTYLRWCRELATAPASPSLDHNDLHDANVFVQRAEPEQPWQARFFDWGDSVLAHPFASLLVPLGLIRQRQQLGMDDPQLARLRDSYLEVWSDLAPRAELIATLELACRCAKVARSLVWARALGTLNEAEAQKLARASLRWLGYLLDDEYLGMGG
jgi:hypothetical protein